MTTQKENVSNQNNILSTENKQIEKLLLIVQFPLFFF